MTSASIFLIPFLATLDSSVDDFLRKNIVDFWLLLSYLDRLGDESELRDLDHDHIVLDRRADTVESEILREDNRS